MGWARSKSINTGKHSEVETFAGANLPAPWGTNASSRGKVQTAIDGERTLVTDQAGKQRISKTNSLGQLLNVWEVKESDTDTEAITFGNLSLSALKTSYQYDTLNNLKQVNQGVQPRTFAYSSLSRLVSANNPESGLISYKYDVNGNLSSKTDARSITTTYNYDVLNRVTLRDYSDTTPDVTYTYDNGTNAKGKLTKVTNGISTTEYTSFDILGRVQNHKQTTDGNIYNSSYAYNLSGALIEETYPSGRVVKNTVDVEGDLAQVQSKKSNGTFQNYANAFTYTSAGAVSSMRLGNGKFENTTFNSRLQPIQIGLGSSATSQNLLKLNFDYGGTDNNGNVKSQTITTPTIGTNQGFTALQTYSYDSLNRLKDAKEMIGTAQQWKQTFTFDRYGNRTFDTANNNTTTLANGCPTAICNPSANPQDNKLVGTNYDSVGNTSQDANGQTFVYDAENKQVQVNNAGGIVGKYWYNGDGQRVKKYVPSTQETTIFVYDASNKLVAEYSTITAPQTEAKVSYLTNDHLGSPRITTDATGNVVSRRDFMPFGEEIARAVNGTDSVRQKFTGYERDAETGLDYAKARMFGSGVGRFTSPDDFLNDTDAVDPKSWNLYVYVRNNPLRFIDPTGERIWIQYQETVTRTDDDGNEVSELVTRRVEYTFDGLRNEDGSAYTGDNSYVLAAESNLNFLLQDPVLGQAIAELVGSKKDFNIMRDPRDPNRNQADPNQKKGQGTNIYWSGKTSMAYANFNEDYPSLSLPAFAGLAHELIGHAWMVYKGIDRDDAIHPPIPGKPGATGTVRGEEIDAVNIENRAFRIEDPSCSSCRHVYGGNDISEFLDSDFLENKRKKRKPPTLKLRQSQPRY